MVSGCRCQQQAPSVNGEDQDHGHHRCSHAGIGPVGDVHQTEGGEAEPEERE